MSNPRTEHTRFAERIARHAEDLGFVVDRASSTLSTSQYLAARHVERDVAVRLRISDHARPPVYGGPADFEVGGYAGAHGCWATAVAYLAMIARRPVPEAAARVPGAERQAAFLLAEAERRAQKLAEREARAQEAAMQRLLRHAQDNPGFAHTLGQARRIAEPAPRARRFRSIARQVGVTPEAVEAAAQALARGRR
jgi:hypothetical protein